MPRSSFINIADELEAQIKAGLLKPNEALPSTLNLSQRMSVSLVTMQKALKRLQEKGLIRRTQQKGSFVNSGLNAKTIGLMYGENPFTTKSSFPRILTTGFIQEAKEQGFEIKLFYDMYPSDPYMAIRLAEAEVAKGELACVILIGGNKIQLNWLENRCSCPWMYNQIADVYDYTFKGISYLLEHGRRKLLALSTFAVGWQDDSEERAVADAFKAMGVPLKGEVVARCGQDFDSGYKGIKKMLGSNPARYDGLLVNHDVIMPGALMALLELGVEVPSKLMLVAHENKGAEIFSPLPVSTLSIDPLDYVRKAIACVRTGDCESMRGFKVKATIMERG